MAMTPEPSFPPAGNDEAPVPDVIAALAEFERWYTETHLLQFARADVA